MGSQRQRALKNRELVRDSRLLDIEGSQCASRKRGLVVANLSYKSKDLRVNSSDQVLTRASDSTNEPNSELRTQSRLFLYAQSQEISTNPKKKKKKLEKERCVDAPSGLFPFPAHDRRIKDHRYRASVGRYSTLVSGAKDF